MRLNGALLSVAVSTLVPLQFQGHEFTSGYAKVTELKQNAL